MRVDGEKQTQLIWNEKKDRMNKTHNWNINKIE